MPSPGRIRYMTEPSGPGIRTDGYAYEGYEIPLYYDPMISKLIAWAKTREDAIERMKRALHEYKIGGVKTSINFLEKVMGNKTFVKGKYDTHFIDENMDSLVASSDGEGNLDEDLAMITAFVNYQEKLSKSQALKPYQGNGGSSPWKHFGRKKGVTRM
jgi:acetyl-CoA carboxylase biotin carboxylase subunit